MLAEPRTIGPYRLDVLLGRGGMGEVYKAWDARLERWVAVKSLLTQGDENEARRKRFLREARIVAGLGHPSIVQIFDILEEDNSDWLVMELVDGSDLATLLKDGPFLPRLAADYGRQIAEGLDAAHRAGIVHRDLKTENIMLGERIKILDFGIARRSQDSNVTIAGRLVGTPRSMSPEQTIGQPADARSDLFALGVLLYETLTGRSPFIADSIVETLQRIATHKQPPVQRLNPRINEDFSRLVDRLLEKNPNHRPQRAIDVVEALQALGDPGRAAQDESQAEVPVHLETLDDHESLPTLEARVRTLLASDLVDAQESFSQEHDQILRDLLEDHGGVEVDRSDGLLMLFERSSDAVHFAQEYHEALRQHFKSDLRARIGIHLGEVILFHNSMADVERGAAPMEVDGQARATVWQLRSLAEGGQTLLTRSAYDSTLRSLEGSGGFRWREHRPHGTHELGDIGIFEVDGVGPGSAEFATPLSTTSTPTRPTVTTPTTTETSATTQATAILRTWPTPKLPENPYPVLLPYTHPDLLAGRDHEIADIRLSLELPIPILGLGAPSGTGKSSFLMGGLIPILRSENKPVALERHPHSPGLAGRLLADLFENAAEIADDDWQGFVQRLEEVERLSAETPLLVIDQFEDLLRDDATEARARLGVLLASTARHRPGIETPICRWLLAYRNEYHGEVLAWLEDVLVDTPGELPLPHDLAGPERFQSFVLSPLANVKATEALPTATALFQEAIEKPLRHFDIRFAQGHSQRLAQAFAKARLARPDAPLVPELQVVLAHLLAISNGDIEVPEDAETLVEEALADHLRRALESAFPSGSPDAALGRARALLALRELATATGQRDEGILVDKLADGIGSNGRDVLALLATPATRLVVFQNSPDGLRCVLSHDQMASAIVDMVEEEGSQGKLIVDSGLLSLRRFVTLKTALHLSEGTESTLATRVPRDLYRSIQTNADALLWDDAQRDWWAACQQRRRTDDWRRTWTVTVAVVFLIVLSWITWRWVQEREQYQALRSTVVEGQPEEAFLALDRLILDAKTSDEDLLGLLRRRAIPMDVLEQGLAGMTEPQRSAAVLRAVTSALPWVADEPENPFLIANMVWALDYSPARRTATAEEAKILRNKILQPLRGMYPPPKITTADPDWVEIPPGSFTMGSPEGEGRDNEHPQRQITVSAFRMLRHEVTNAEYRRLVPDHEGADDLPVGLRTWYDAYTYAAWLGGRLPTEAEWEYAARAACAFAYCTRDGREATVDEVAWTQSHPRRAVPDDEAAPSSVMTLEPNPWGLYDMLGNHWEWTTDLYDVYPNEPTEPNPWGPLADSGQRVLRGGGYVNAPDRSRVARRHGNPPGLAGGTLGFRIVLPQGITTRSP